MRIKNNFVAMIDACESNFSNGGGEKREKKKGKRAATRSSRSKKVENEM